MATASVSLMRRPGECSAQGGSIVGALVLLFNSLLMPSQLLLGRRVQQGRLRERGAADDLAFAAHHLAWTHGCSGAGLMQVVEVMVAATVVSAAS